MRFVIAVMLGLTCFGMILNNGSWADELPIREELKRAQDAATEGKHQTAVDLLDAVIQRDGKLAFAYYLRGREQFRLGKIEASVVDFDKCVELDPNSESRLWERGITQYYAGKFAEGAKQFELYQTFYDQDVENSVWRFACSAKVEGVEKARENMLPIDRDPRVPMMEIYDLFRGKKSVDDVLAAAKAGSPNARTLENRQFYADLYIALYYEAVGETEKARPFMQAAAEHAEVAEYMGDVARVHVERWKEKK